LPNGADGARQKPSDRSLFTDVTVQDPKLLVIAGKAFGITRGYPFGGGRLRTRTECPCSVFSQ
jgi:hypothetical protein